MHPGAAKAEVALAKELDGELSDTGAALAAGRISVDRARAVAAGMRALPTAVDPATRRRAEAYLLENAEQFDPDALYRLSRHLVVVLDPDRGEELERDEAKKAERQEFTLTRRQDGSRHFRGQVGPEAGALLDAALEAVSGPRPAEDGTPDPRPAPQRRAEGLIELVKTAIGSEQMPEPAGEPVTMTVTTTADYLQTRTTHQSDTQWSGAQWSGTRWGGTQWGGTRWGGTQWGGTRWGDAPPGSAGPGSVGPVATLEDGTALSPESTRRLGCDAWVVGALVGSYGEVLDIGRMSRVVPRPIRRALTVRDRGCAFTGCGRPPASCNAHHIWHWSLGGPTALANLVLLCGHHHHVVHHRGWDVDIGPDGHPHFTPPAWIDPSQTPRPAWRPPGELLLE